MLRWLLRLAIIGLIGLAVAYAITRLMGEEEDFDEFDDIEEGFEFTETPVEIDVPAEEGTRTGMGTATAASNMETGTLSESTGTDTGSGGAGASTLPLSEINGIGPNYEARLQAAGINTIEDLANADPNALNEQIEVIGGVSTIESWITQAREYVSDGSLGRSNGSSEQ